MSDIPTGWETKKLGQVTNLIMGQSPSSDTYNTERNGLPFFQGKADFGTHYPKIRTWCSEPTKIAPENSILFSVRAPVGDVNITKTECCIGRGLASMQGKSVNQDYLYQQIQFVKPQFQLIAQGSTFEAVNGSEIKNFPILVPPLPEQQKISSILTSVDEVIEKTQSQINKLQDLKKGTMNELLTRGIGHTEFVDSPVGKIPKGWGVHSVGEYANVVDPQPDHRTPAEVEGGIPYIGMAEIDENRNIKFDDARKVSIEAFEKQKKGFDIHNGAFIFGKIGTIGNPILIPEKRFYCLSANVILITSDNFIVQQFLYYIFQSHIVDKQVADQTNTTSQPALGIKKVRDFYFPLPPQEEQQKIASTLSSIDQNVANKQRKLEQTKSLKKSLMQDLLTGKVRVPVQ